MGSMTSTFCDDDGGCLLAADLLEEEEEDGLLEDDDGLEELWEGELLAFPVKCDLECFLALPPPPGGSLDAARFLFVIGMGVSGGSKPISIEIAIAFGIESQDLPLGAIHLRRRRFCENRHLSISSSLLLL